MPNSSIVEPRVTSIRSGARGSARSEKKRRVRGLLLFLSSRGPSLRIGLVGALAIWDKFGDRSTNGPEGRRIVEADLVADEPDAQSFPELPEIDWERGGGHLPARRARARPGRRSVCRLLRGHGRAPTELRWYPPSATMARRASSSDFLFRVRSRMSRLASRQKSAPPQYVRPQVCVVSSPSSPAMGNPLGSPRTRPPQTVSADNFPMRARAMGSMYVARPSSSQR